MLKRLGVMVMIAGVLLGAAACDEEDATELALYVIGVDGASPDFGASFIAYFPNTVQVHPGDEIEFESVFTGEPHTVTMGTQVNAIADLIAEGCPNGGIADPACQEGPPEAIADRYIAADALNPQLLGEEGVNQSAGQACFLATGAPPEDGSACTEQEQPDFDGTQTFYNSGFLENEQVFAVQLSDDIAPGTYTYYCLLHREGMMGTIEVVEEGAEVPSPEEVEEAGQTALDEMISGLQPEVDRIRALPLAEAQMGAFSEEEQLANITTINAFGPEALDVAAGESVSWTLRGFHTLAFNPPASATPWITFDADGNVVINEEGQNPAVLNGPPEPSGDAPTPDPLNIDGGSFPGEGFANSGHIDAFEGTVTYEVMFPTAGTYTVICLIHPDMEATVNVGG
jgi:plastocyanin